MHHIILVLVHERNRTHMYTRKVVRSVSLHRVSASEDSVIIHLHADRTLWDSRGPSRFSPEHPWDKRGLNSFAICSRSTLRTQVISAPRALGSGLGVHVASSSEYFSSKLRFAFKFSSYIFTFLCHVFFLVFFSLVFLEKLFSTCIR